jgi:uncharacterized protein YkwD
MTMKNLVFVLFVFVSQVLFSQVTYKENDPFAKITKQSVDLVNATDYNMLSKQLMNQINDYRVKSGLSKLSYDEKMFSYAKSYSDTMVMTNSYQHSDLNGGEYSLENINLLKTVGSILVLDETWVKTIPSLVLHSWVTSPGHNANLLNKDVTKVGISISSVVYMKNGFYVHDLKAVMVAK